MCVPRGAHAPSLECKDLPLLGSPLPQDRRPALKPLLRPDQSSQHTTFFPHRALLSSCPAHSSFLPAKPHLPFSAEQKFPSYVKPSLGLEGREGASEPATAGHSLPVNQLVSPVSSWTGPACPAPPGFLAMSHRSGLSHNGGHSAMHPANIHVIAAGQTASHAGPTEEPQEPRGNEMADNQHSVNAT